MDWNYDGEFWIARIVSGAFIASVVVFAIIIEYLLSPFSTTTLISRFDELFLATLSAIFYGTTFLLLSLAFILKVNIRHPPTAGVMHRVLRAMTRNLHRTSTGSAVAHLITPGVMLELIAVLGLVNFFFTAGDRRAAYPFLGIALVSMIWSWPQAYEKDNLIALDKAVQAEAGSP